MTQWHHIFPEYRTVPSLAGVGLKLPRGHASANDAGPEGIRLRAGEQEEPHRHLLRRIDGHRDALFATYKDNFRRLAQNEGATTQSLALFMLYWELT